MAYIIKTITKGYAGKVGGVNFVDGKGTTDSKSLAAWFSNAGYLVKEVTENEKEKAEEKETFKPFKEDEIKDLNVDDLKKLLDERNIEYRSNAKKAELIELLTSGATEEKKE